MKKMANLTWRQEAIDDLSDIWNYTTRIWSRNQADKYYHSIKSACKKIATNPYIGKVYKQISRNLLGLKAGKHIIFYIILSEDKIEIIRILHEQMDLRNRMKE